MDIRFLLAIVAIGVFLLAYLFLPHLFSRRRVVIGVAIAIVLLALITMQRLLLSPPVVVIGPGATAVVGQPTAAPGAEPTTSLSSTVPPEPTELSLADAVQAELARLAEGRILYNPPTQMTQGKEERIEVRITQSMTGDLQSGLQGSGTPVVEPVKTAPFMKAKLLGDDFTITPFSSEEQPVGETGFTEWVWNVMPEEAGDDKKLHLVVTARVEAKGIVGAKDLLVKDVKIAVKVNAMYSGRKFAEHNWQWIVTAIVIPLAVYFWSQRRKTQESGDTTKATRRKPGKKR